MNRKDKKLPALAAIATKLVQQTEHGLGGMCSTTGLFIPCDLPPLAGMVLEAKHPICYNALAILRQPDYWKALPADKAAALILASLDALGKLSLEATALQIRVAMEAGLSLDQLHTFLTFISGPMLKTKRHYPKITLRATTNEHTLLAYMATCTDVENTTFSWEARPTNLAVVPKFLSSATQGKTLDKDCYEAWLEVAPFLLPGLKTKAKPYIKTLATNLNSQLVERLVSAVVTATPEEGDGLLEASEFSRIVAAARTKAAALGLHRSEFDEAPLLAAPAAPAVAIEAPVEAPVPATGLSFSERMAAKLAAKKGL